MSMSMDIMEVQPPNEPAYALLAQLHRRAFEPQGDGVWNATAFRQLIESPGVRAAIFQRGDHPAGFYLYRVVLDEAELISIGVDPAFRGDGVAVNMMQHMLQALDQETVGRFFLEVREDNKAAIHLYRKFDFDEVGVRSNYYQNNDGKKIDAIVFSLALNSSRNA